MRASAIAGFTTAPPYIPSAGPSPAPHRDLEVGEPAQRTEIDGTPGREHRGIRNHHGVAGEPVRVPLDERRQVHAADLLLTLDEDDHVHGQRAPRRELRLERLHVHPQLSLVVHGPAREHLAVPDRGLEWRRRPELERLGRLHIVVAVDEHGRRPRRRLPPFGEHHRMARRGHRLRDEPDLLELRVQPRRGAARVGVVLRPRAHAGNPEEREELVEDPRVVPREPRVEVGGNCRSGHGHCVQGNG